MFAPLVATISILSAFIILQLVIDTVRVRRFKRVTEGLLQIGKQQSLTTISIIIKARSSKQQVVELLDHLASFNYDKLQIVVVPRSRKNDRSSNYLTQYRTSHPDMNIRIVRSGRRDDKTLITRHARGELLLWMDTHERLSQRFFELASYEFANPLIDRVEVPYRFKTARTITDLLATWSVIRADAMSIMKSKHTSSRRHSLYRRASFKRNINPEVHVKSGTQLSFIQPRNSPTIRSAFMAVGNLLIAAALGYAALYYLSTQWLFTVLAIASAYLLTNLFWLVSSKRYTLHEAIPLVAALPFAVIGIFTIPFKRS